jgi:hypothetical protein
MFVHVDIDFAFLKPMDHLFDALLYDKETEKGSIARRKIKLERVTDECPDRIEAFITRDWHQVSPHRFPPGYQAGFMVGRRNPEVFDEVIEVIRQGNFSEGCGHNSGWGNKCYGGYVGAMAMQGLMGYYYDHIRPNTAVELNHCRYNHMGVDVRYNRPPNFKKKYKKTGECRNGSPYDVCEDCMVTESEDIHSIHYTMCSKPWSCHAIGHPGGKIPGQGRMTAINTDTVHLDHCMKLQHMWHSLRLDLENQLFNLTEDASIRDGATGTYKSDVFLGHCKDDGGDGNDGYLMLSGKEDRISELYGY